MDHSLLTLADLLTDSLHDRDPHAGCSPFPECAGVACDDAVLDFCDTDSVWCDYDGR